MLKCLRLQSPNVTDFIANYGNVRLCLGIQVGKTFTFPASFCMFADGNDNNFFMFVGETDKISVFNENCVLTREIPNITDDDVPFLSYEYKFLGSFWIRASARQHGDDVLSICVTFYDVFGKITDSYEQLIAYPRGRHRQRPDLSPRAKYCLGGIIFFEDCRLIHDFKGRRSTFLNYNDNINVSRMILAEDILFVNFYSEWEAIAVIDISDFFQPKLLHVIDTIHSLPCSMILSKFGELVLLYTDSNNWNGKDEESEDEVENNFYRKESDKSRSFVAIYSKYGEFLRGFLIWFTSSGKMFAWNCESIFLDPDDSDDPDDKPRTFLRIFQ